MISRSQHSLCYINMDLPKFKNLTPIKLAIINVTKTSIGQN